MGNCCKAASSMEWGGEDWESLKVHDEAVHQNKENDVLGKLRDSCDVNGKVTLKISRRELAELLGAIQQPQKQMKKKKKELGSAEEVLYRLIKAKDHGIVSKHWKPMLESIPESY
ncbi:unnamed protein product [Lathyrus sativus]|nr:unnamed protein product [Lathyrus sativus]